MFITLFLGFSKRCAEWTEVAGAAYTAPGARPHSRELLDTFLSITATGTVFSYGLYTLDPATIALHHTNKLIYTLPFVLFGFFATCFSCTAITKARTRARYIHATVSSSCAAWRSADVRLWLLSRQ